MATVRMMLSITDTPSEDQLQMLREASDRPIIYDEDSPEMTDEMLAKFKRVHPEGSSVIHAT